MPAGVKIRTNTGFYHFLLIEIFEGGRLENKYQIVCSKQIENRATDAMENANRCPEFFARLSRYSNKKFVNVHSISFIS